MQDKANESAPTITLSAAAAVSLRLAAYARLEKDVEALEEALVMSRDRAVDRKAWAAHMRLARTAALLARAGWTYREHRPPMRLQSAEHVALAVSMLREELAAESNVKATAIAEGAEADALASSRRELAVYETLSCLEAVAATAGLLAHEPPASA